MSILNRDELTGLINHDADTCISIFMPTHRTGRERQQDPIRLKNLVSDARQQLQASNNSEADQLLEPVDALRDDAEFWEHQQDGLAIFRSADFLRVYRVPMMLETDVTVNTRFHVRPLIQLLQGNARFFVLAISQDHAQLLEATRYSIRDMHLESVLETVKQAAGEQDEEPSLQFRTLSAGPRGRGPAMFHGHGGAADASKQEIMKYFQAVDRAIAKMLRGENAPLVLACVGYLASIYESANSYAGLIREKVPGNPGLWALDELRDKAAQLAAPVLNHRRDEALQRFENACGTDRAETDIREIVLAANDGRVDALFLEKSQQVWGDYDRDLRAVHLSSDGRTSGEDLLDVAAGQTLIHGGDVFSLEQDQFPSDRSPAAALLRYAA